MTFNSKRLRAIVKYIQKTYDSDLISLHRPFFQGNERQYLVDCVDSNFVSSVGQRVVEFEQQVTVFTGIRYAVATVNGTAALHIALQLIGVRQGDEVITQALTFVATCNAISYMDARPVFVDVDRDTLGMSAQGLRQFLAKNAEWHGGQIINKISGRRLAACVPMHTFGHPCQIDEIVAICNEYNIPVVEDAAESLGSYYKDRHTGIFGQIATLSFNGNKIITTGGGGMIITNDEALAMQAKHLTTTAKVVHPYEFIHDEVGYNYRMPNLNAALGCAQMEQLDEFLVVKRKLAQRYADFFAEQGIAFVEEPTQARSNYWLNAIILNSLAERNAFLEYTNQQGVMTRPIWRLMTKLDMFKNCQHDGLENSTWLEQRVVNIPSSVPGPSEAIMI